MFAHAADQARLDSVYQLSDLIRRIDRGRDAVLRSAGASAFGYTSGSAADEVLSLIDEVLAMCRRCENFLQMWSALTAATAAADGGPSAAPAIEPLAEEVRQPVESVHAPVAPHWPAPISCL